MINYSLSLQIMTRISNNHEYVEIFIARYHWLQSTIPDALGDVLVMVAMVEVEAPKKIKYFYVLGLLLSLEQQQVSKEEFNSHYSKSTRPVRS